MHPFKAIGLKLISALLFAAMSALVRQLGDVAPVGQMVFFRSVFAILPVMVIYAIRGELSSALRTGRPFGQLGRGLLSVCGMFTNFSSLTRLPLANATAISFASPLITVALAAIVLKERVRIYRWSAVLIGFAGVIVMLIPHLDIGAYARTGGALAAVGSAFAIVAAFCNAGTVIQNSPTHKNRDDFVDRFLLFPRVRDRGRPNSAVRLAFADCTRAHGLIALGILGGLAHILLTESYRYGRVGGCAFRLFVIAVGVTAWLLVVRRTARHVGLFGCWDRYGCWALCHLARTSARRPASA